MVVFFWERLFKKNEDFLLKTKARDCKCSATMTYAAGRNEAKNQYISDWSVFQINWISEIFLNSEQMLRKFNRVYAELI